MTCFGQVLEKNMLALLLSNIREEELSPSARTKCIGAISATVRSNLVALRRFLDLNGPEVNIKDRMAAEFLLMFCLKKFATALSAKSCSPQMVQKASFFLRAIIDQSNFSGTQEEITTEVEKACAQVTQLAIVKCQLGLIKILD